jgi:mRNA interferase MazF
MVNQDHLVPERGDVVMVRLNPQVWYEQSGARPAVIISPAAYNEKVGLALLCPVTSEVKGYPFEVLIPEGLPVSGAVLSDRVKSLDWRARKAEWVCRLPPALINEVLGKLRAVLEW